MEQKENTEIKKPNRKRDIIIVIFAILLVILIFQYNNIRFFILDLSNKYSEDYLYADDSDEYNYENANKRLEDFELSVLKLENENGGLILKNKSQKAYSDLKLNVIFYDGDRKPIAVDTTHINCILPDKEWIGQLYNFPKEYETYDFLVTASNYDLTETLKQFNSVEINQVFDDSTNMSVRFKNNYGKKIDSATAAAIYYDQNGNACNIEYFTVFDLRANKTKDEESYEYLDFKKEGNSGVEIFLVNVNVY